MEPDFVSENTAFCIFKEVRDTDALNRQGGS